MGILKTWFDKTENRWWAFRRRRAEQTITDAYLRTAPKGQPPSSDIAINNYYARMREQSQTLSPSQAAAMRVQEETLTRANDPPKPRFVEERSDHDGGGNIGHLVEPTVRVDITLPALKGKDE